MDSVVTLKSNYLTVYNTLLMRSGAAKIYGSSKRAEIWAGDIDIDKLSDNSSLTIIGDMFIADDLEVTGSNSTVSLFGTYTGFGKANDITGLKDSSIAVNGKGTTLDLSGIEKLIIGGNAYFPLYRKDGTVIGNSYDKTGEALALIINENLYQVSDRYIHEGGGRYVDNILTDDPNDRIRFADIKDEDGISLTEYLSSSMGYKLVSSGVDMTSPESEGGLGWDTDTLNEYINTNPFRDKRF